MSKITTAIYLLKLNRNEFLASILTKVNFLFPDKLYLSLLFRLRMGFWIDWKNPKTFSEKLQWLKLYDRNQEYTTIVDKYAVKDYVAKIIGKEHIIPTLGVWDYLEDIEWDKLPQQFVLKTTHGGGGSGVVICKDKSTFNKADAIVKLKKSFKECIYKSLREWPYKNVDKKIIAEEFLSDASEYNNEGLTDYKFYCFNGKAYKVMLCLDRHKEDTKFYSFDKEWNLLRHNKRGLAAPIDFTLPKPPCMDEMFKIAEDLSKGIPFARVDLYYVNNKIYFSEITFYPDSGLDENILPEIDKLYGSMIELHKERK